MTELSQTLSVQIGGVRLHAQAVGDGLGLTASAAMMLFRCPADGEPDVRATVDWGEQRAGDPGRLLFRSGGLWDLWRDGEQLVYRLSSPAFGPLPYQSARFDLGLSRGNIEVNRSYARKRVRPGIEPFAFPLDELLLAHRLPRMRGIELHACGIVDKNGHGHLFVGQSGAGKTTAAGLWSRHLPGTVLSDDRIVVRLGDSSGPRMYGTPWHGEASLSVAADAPLRAVYLLRKHRSPALLPLHQARAAAALLACSFIPFHDPEGLGLSMDTVSELVAKVPCWELHSRGDEAMLDLLHAC